MRDGFPYHKSLVIKVPQNIQRQRQIQIQSGGELFPKLCRSSAADPVVAAACSTDHPVKAGGEERRREGGAQCPV